VTSPTTCSGAARSTTAARVTSCRAKLLATSRSVLSPYTVSTGTAGPPPPVRGTIAGVMTSAAKNVSSGSVEYSRVRWMPRRATFSVSTERLRISADTA
jgi:hypothetical protein